ncbi:hypothetical protein TorRG33x02_188160, partial [Trema orientale]
MAKVLGHSLLSLVFSQTLGICFHFSQCLVILGWRKIHRNTTSKDALSALS